ncbi:MAG: hypothetical protein K8I30_14015 [Anaerolineae bacterium]|nr:hypothetical protein [Anaerolineae bacterium]
MAAQRVQDMTLDELTQLIDARIHRVVFRRTDTRTPEEVNESIRRNRWTPPPGAKSPRELLREDRNA